MTHEEFCNAVVPLVLELQDLCKKMTEKEFSEYRKNIIQEIHSNKLDISKRFMSTVFDIIYKNVFQPE